MTKSQIFYLEQQRRIDEEAITHAKALLAIRGATATPVRIKALSGCDTAAERAELIEGFLADDRRRTREKPLTGRALLAAIR